MIDEPKVKKSTLNLANRITLCRILLIPVFVILILNYESSKPDEGEWLRIVANIVFCVTVLTDALDGFIARTQNQKTQLGTFLDPLADKLLLMTSIILLTLSNEKFGYRFPFWFTVLVISRDVVITLGSLLIHILNGSVKIIPSIVGKLATASQMAAIFWILLKWPNPQYFVYVAASFTIASGVGYMLFGSRQLNGRAVNSGAGTL